VESVGQALSAIAAAVLLLGSVAGFITARLEREQTEQTRPQRTAELAEWGWRGGLSIGVGALLLSVIFRGASSWPPLASAGDRAAVVALVGGLLCAGVALWRRARSTGRPLGWAGMVPIAIVAGISAYAWPLEDGSAPWLLACTLVAAGVGLWGAGEALNGLTVDRRADRWPSLVAMAGLTATVVIVGGVNWRVWGTPGAHSEFLGLLAVWTMGAAGLVLRARAARFVSALGVVAGAALVGIALSVQWTMPFG
jgi:hypothetical protein